MYNSRDLQCAMCENEDPFYCNDCDENYNKFIAKTKPSEKNVDNVNHPKHYENYSVECIIAMEETQGTEAVISFCVCNAFKYLWRHNAKNGYEDIKKAQWYINKAIELKEKRDKYEQSNK